MHQHDRPIQGTLLDSTHGERPSAVDTYSNFVPDGDRHVEDFVQGYDLERSCVMHTSGHA
jgi:hypothetical protein